MTLSNRSILYIDIQTQLDAMERTDRVFYSMGK